MKLCDTWGIRWDAKGTLALGEKGRGNTTRLDSFSARRGKGGNNFKGDPFKELWVE